MKIRKLNIEKCCHLLQKKKKDYAFPMEIRRYHETDLSEICQLFHNTVHSMNALHYNERQLDAWSPENNDHAHLKNALRNNNTYVAVEDNQIVGFADIDENGYLDHLFVHKDYQRKGIATALLKEIEERHAYSQMETHASITARPFFEKMGFTVEKAQDVKIRGEKLRNYVMKKS